MPGRIGPHLLGRRADPDHPRAASLYPASAILPPRSLRTLRYWWEGGAWLDQGDTGECVGHAFAHRYADAPTPHTGITHAWAERLYLDATHVDQWADNDGDIMAGTSGLAACAVLRSRGQVTEYRWVGAPDDLITAVLDWGTVCVGTDWYNSMFTPYSAWGRSYLRVDRSSGIAGGHEYLLNGISLAPADGPPFFRMKNSWGRGWGHGGTARISVDDLTRLVFDHGGDAVLVTEAS